MLLLLEVGELSPTLISTGVYLNIPSKESIPMKYLI